MSNTHEMVVDTLAVEIFISSSMKVASLFFVACQSNSGPLYYKCNARVVIEVQLTTSVYFAYCKFRVTSFIYYKINSLFPSAQYKI